jgi:translation initiation factor 3 subunit I
VSADGKFIYTSSKDKVVLCWSRAERLLKATCTYGGHEGAVWAVDVSAQTPAILASGSADGKVLFWPTEGRGSSTRSGVIEACGSLAHGGIVKALRWCPFDKNKFVTCADKLGSIPFHIAVWEADANGRGAKNVIKMLELPAKANAVQWGDGAKKKIFSAHENGYVAVWGADDGKLLKTLKLHAQPVTGICLASDGITLLSASRDRTACVVDVSTPTAPTLRTYKTDRPLNAVAVTPTFNPKEDDEASKKNGAVLLGGGQDEMQVTQTKVVEGEFEALIYSNEGERWGSGKGHFGPVHAIRTVPGKQDMFATGAEDGCLYVHDLYGEMLHADNTR